MISNVYSYYLSQYGDKSSTKYSAHKSSELKSIYNKMLKINRVSPFYKIDISEDAQKYAIDLKENASELTNITNELSSSSDTEQMEFKKLAESSDENAVHVEYIGGNGSYPVNTFEVNVKQLATTQINTGNYLQQKSNHFDPGEYSFDLNISDLTYEFELSVSNSDNTKSIQDKISRLVNRSNIGLNSEVLSDSLDNTSIKIESEGTGVSNMNPTIFSIMPTNTNESADESDSKKNNLVEILGLNRTSQYPSNAIFTIDDNEITSTTNSYTINNAFLLNFNDVTVDQPVTISLKDDSKSIVNSITQLVDGYNKLISVTTDENNNKFEGNLKLKKEFTNIARSYNELLKTNGLNVSDDGSLNIDHESIQQSASSGNIINIFASLGTFKNAIQSKAENIALNPMNYVNNKIVSYKNPHLSLTDPYNTSLYSGMMFNGFI